MPTIYTYPPMRKEQLRDVMGIHRNTMTKYLRQLIHLGILPPATARQRLLHPQQVEAFCRHFGISPMDLC